MPLLVCPGIHPPALTDCFLADLSLDSSPPDSACWVFPAQDYPAWSAFHIRQFLQNRLDQQQLTVVPPLTLIGFSAGVVGAIATALHWQHHGGKIAALIALDGWGVPLVVNFPVYRLSHDHFTHWSSAVLGGGSTSFYADPAVPHLELWRRPQQATGWQVVAASTELEKRSRTTAANFVRAILHQHASI